MLKLSLSSPLFGLEILISPPSTDEYSDGLVDSFDGWKTECDNYYTAFRQALREGNYPLANEVMSKLVDVHASASLTIRDMVLQAGDNDEAPSE